MVIKNEKSQKYGTPRKIWNGKSIIKGQYQKLERMDNNCHIPDFGQEFSGVENGELNLILKLDEPQTCMTVASNCNILTIYDVW